MTGIPIGPVNVAVIDGAYRHSLKRALGVGVGGGAADLAFAYLGLVWIGPWILSNPIVPPILYLLSGIVLVIYGFVTIRSQPMETTKPSTGEDAPPAASFLGGVFLGAVLIVLNPAALITWTVIVGSQPIMVDALHQEATACAIGVGVGSTMWFCTVAWLANKGKNILGHKMLLITRVVGALLVGYGVFSVIRSIYMFIKL